MRRLCPALCRDRDAGLAHGRLRGRRGTLCLGLRGGRALRLRLHRGRCAGGLAAGFAAGRAAGATLAALAAPTGAELAARSTGRCGRGLARGQRAGGVRAQRAVGHPVICLGGSRAHHQRAARQRSDDDGPNHRARSSNPPYCKNELIVLPRLL